jgi:hypothetical protein
MNGFHKFSKLQPGIGLPSFLPKSIGPYLPSALSRLYGQLTTGGGLYLAEMSHARVLTNIMGFSGHYLCCLHS